ncbi:glutamine and serine-rich protein 1-like [Anguilla anguilla]|uniref:glutamine and serine-rich protein 1-like n=1 Tax=Anguilla anguilla TaxID=7936 RepID=UPI0015AA0DC5|nr:glutamine and serine-rich protein 1-like [Anguilla anguilla]
MMDRNYPTSSFADQLAPPAQTAAWAYERSTASIKPSSTYGAAPPESELLQRQTYASNHQPSTFATAHHPTGLSGIFDAGLHAANSSTTEASVMSFLSAVESRTPQAGPASASLLPQFRTPSWQTGMNSSAATELFVAGALPTGTIPTPYQHHNSFSTRSFSTAPSLALQDASFTSSTNGILSPQDHLLQIKPAQGSVPPALPFDRFSSTPLSASVPPQSSTYRSAQESAPHLLQPQFSLLPSAVSGAQATPQTYGTSVFAGSLERALQRECSVIKHHQRPSSTQSMQSQLSGSTQHSLQGYMAGGGGEITFQSSPREPAVLPCSPVGESTQVSDSRLQQKTSQSTLEQTQAYPSSISSPTFSSPSGTKNKDCSSRHTQQTPEANEPHGSSPDLRPQSYPSPIQRQSPVIAGQPQAYTSAQLPSLMPVSPLQHYVTSPTVPNQGQVCSSSQLEKLPSFYKTLTTFSGQSVNVTPASQSLVYSSGQQQGLLSVGRSEEYGAQAQGNCQGNTAQSFSSSHSQTLPTASYSAQSQGLATVSLSQSYTSGHSLVLTSEALSFSSTRAQNLPTSSPTQEYILMQPSPSIKTENTLSPQPQKYLPPVQSPTFSLASHSQALQNNQSSADLKLPYSKRKLDASTFIISKQEGDEFPVQDLQGLQQSSQDPTTQTLAACDTGEQNKAGHANSKVDDRYNSQSVIRSSMQPEDQIMGLALSESKKDERMVSLNHHKQHMTAASTSQVTTDSKRNSPLLQSSHVTIGTEELNKQHSLLQVPESQLLLNHQIQGASAHQQSQNHMVQQTQYIRLPSAQVLLEPSRDLQRILLQQPLFHSGFDSTKLSTQMQQIPVHYLQMDDQAIGHSDSHSQQQVVLSQGSDVLKMGIAEASKSIQQQHPLPKENFGQTNQHDAKHHFALSSICFPDSVLLGDDRNILSNVDDILAATAAACGVTPQDFVKATSSEGEIPSLANPIDSKGHFQFVDTRHISPSFSSSHPITASTHTVAMTQNSAHLNIGIHQLPKSGSLEHQAIELSNVSMQHELTGSAFSSGQDIGERVVGSLHRSRSISQVSQGEKKTLVEDGTVGYSNGSFNPCGRSLNDESTTSENDLQQTAEECDPMGIMNKTNLPKDRDHAQNLGQKTVKLDPAGSECSTNSFSKKKAKSKGSNKLVGEDENGYPKSAKRSGQGKRQNSRGSETSSPSTSDSCYDGYQQQERMRQKIREVEEKQPEVKTGFIGSFLDFLKSGPKQQFSSPPIRMPNRSRKAPASFKRPSGPLPLTSKPQPLPAPLTSPEVDAVSTCKRLDEELKRNLEALPSFSSDEDDSVGKNQDLQKSITSALSALDDPSEKKSHFGVTEKNNSGLIIKQEQSHNVPSSGLKTEKQGPVTSVEMSAPEQLKEFPPDQLATQLNSVAIEGLTDEDLSDSGGEGMYRERDEFVVKIEDIECLKMTLTAGHEPPAIWKVQKALLQKFVPELRDGTRVFSATNSYLGYFGDAKTLYRRVYVKFIDTVNKREYVRVCSRKPRCKPMHSMRGSHAKALLGQRAASTAVTDPCAPKPASSKPPAKPKAKQPKVKAEPPPKKRKKWKEFSSSPTVLSPEAVSEDDEFTPPVPFATRFLNTRTMKEAFRSYVELLIGVALDSSVMETLEKENDELLLPHMKRVDGMITDNRRRLLPKLRVGQLFKNALDSFPELSVVAELTKDGETPTFKVRLSGKAYHKKTMRPSKASSKLPLEYTVEKEKTQWFSLYHSLQHYKYHTFLICKDEIASLQTQGRDLGQEEMVQLCMGDGKWVEGLFDKFGELLTQVQQTCLL